MIRRRVTWGAMLVLVVGAAATRAGAAPPRINDLTDRVQFNAQDRDSIAQYARYWADQLVSAPPEEVADARKNLLAPVRLPLVGDAFRWEYSVALLPHLEAIATGNNDHAAYNAVQVAGFLATERALDLILAHSSAEDEPRVAIRVAAAQAFRTAIRAQDSLRRNVIDRGLRRLGRAAEDEPDWRVLQRQFEAIALTGGMVSQEVQVGLLREIAKRMSEQKGPSDLMNATQPALRLVRDQFIRLTQDQQAGFGRELAPVLCDVCTVAKEHWEKAQADPEAKKTYGGAVQLAENLLTLIDNQTDPPTPRTQLRDHWKQQDYSHFDEDHEKWKAELRRPPYHRRP